MPKSELERSRPVVMLKLKIIVTLSMMEANFATLHKKNTIGVEANLSLFSQGSSGFPGCGMTETESDDFWTATEDEHSTRDKVGVKRSPMAGLMF